MALSTTATGAREALHAGSENGFNSDTIWSAVSAKARLALSIIIGNNRLNRGDTADESEGGGGASLTQPGRGLGPSSISHGTSPAEVSAIAAAASARGRQPAPSAPSGGGKGAVAGGGGGGGGDDPSTTDPGSTAGNDRASSFRSRIHDSFMIAFAARMLDECGIAVIDMSLEDVRITDPKLAEAMARGAIARADLAKASIEKSIRITNSEAERAADIVRAEGKAGATEIMARAEAARVRLLDETFAKALSPLTSQREAILAAGEAMRGCNASLVFANNMSDAAMMLGGGGGGGAANLLAKRGITTS